MKILVKRTNRNCELQLESYSVHKPEELNPQVQHRILVQYMVSWCVHDTMYTKINNINNVILIKSS